MLFQTHFWAEQDSIPVISVSFNGCSKAMEMFCREIGITSNGISSNESEGDPNNEARHIKQKIPFNFCKYFLSFANSLSKLPRDKRHKVLCHGLLFDF